MGFFVVAIHIINYVMTHWALYKSSISEQLRFLPWVQSVQAPTIHSCTSHTDPNPLFTTWLRPAENIRTALFYFIFNPIEGNAKKRRKATISSQQSWLDPLTTTSGCRTTYVSFLSNRSQCALSEASSGTASGILHTLIVKTAVTLVTGTAQWGHVGRDKQIVTRLGGRLKRLSQISAEARSAFSRVHVAKFPYEAFAGSQQSRAARQRHVVKLARGGSAAIPQKATDGKDLLLK